MSANEGAPRHLVDKLAKKYHVDNETLDEILNAFAYKALANPDSRKRDGMLTDHLRARLGAESARQALQQIAGNDDFIWDILQLAQEAGQHASTRHLVPGRKITQFVNSPKDRQISASRAMISEVHDNL